MSDFTGGCCETYELDEYNCIPSKIDQDQLHKGNGSKNVFTIFFSNAFKDLIKTLARSFIHGAIAGASIEIAGKLENFESFSL